MTYRAHRMFEFGSRRLIAADPIYSGSHRMEGIFLAQGPDVARGRSTMGFRILDLAPTILHLMGVPVPTSMDGRVLSEAFEPGSSAAEASYALTSRPSRWAIRRAAARVAPPYRL